MERRGKGFGETKPKRRERESETVEQRDEEANERRIGAFSGANSEAFVGARGFPLPSGARVPSDDSQLNGSFEAIRRLMDLTMS